MRAYKYKSKFSKEWTKTWSFVAPVPHSPFTFRCRVCCKTLSYVHQGIADVRTHIAGKNHQRLARGMEARTQLSFTPDPLADKVSRQSKSALPFVVITPKKIWKKIKCDVGLMIDRDVAEKRTTTR